MTLSPGSKLGPYEILAMIGAGGMGEVYRAKDKRLGRTVAIKILNKDHVQRFEREARTIAALNHPHICTLHDIGPDYLVMEYVDGAAIKGPLPVEQAVRLAIQIAGALDEAHRNGILHRDLKPGNIMVTTSGTTKLLDFGLAKLAVSADSETASTMEGTVMGTPAYMSPEQAQGKPVDARSDIFSFGAVLYEIISGNRPFEGTSTAQVLSAVLRDEPKPLQTLPQLERIVMRCLAKQPAQRYQTMAEVKAALEQVAAKPAEQKPSIAVLPFVNMSGDKEQEYFSDGLAEEIINALVQIPALKVTARTSAFAFKGKQEDIRKIAEALGVANILEGSVRRSGNRIRVTAQLIAAADGNHIWSERYDREMTDVFEIQDEISRAISAKLRVRLSGNRPLVKRRTENLEAYNLNLVGRYHLSKYAPDSLVKGKECFEKAIKLDPNYALAWFGLAHFYYVLSLTGSMPANKAYAECLKATLKAMELDNTLPQAHAMMGVLQGKDYKWREANVSFQRALELSPESGEVFVLYSIFYLLPMRRWDEAIDWTRKALELDPLASNARGALGTCYAYAGQFDRAIEQLQKALELDPHLPTVQLHLGLSYIQTGRYDEGIRAVEMDALLAGRHPASLGSLGVAYACAGQVEKAQKVLEELQERAQKSDVPAYPFAIIYLALEQIDKGFDWLEKAGEEREHMAVLWIRMPIFDRLRSHPRYHAMLHKMNLKSGKEE